MSIDINLPLGPFKDALKTLWGSIIAAVLVSMVGGFLAILITYWGDTSFSEWRFQFLLGWIGHWVVACLMAWGFLFLILQCVGLHALIYGSRDPLFILGLMLANQVFVSIVAMIAYEKWAMEIHRPLIGGGIFFAVMGFALWKMHSKGYSKAAM